MKLKVYNNESNSPKPNQPLLPGACAVILDKEKIFLHKRDDSDLWSLPGGTMELGESISQCCLREVMEETGLESKIEKLIGIYTSPMCVFEWKDGKESMVWQSFVVAFLVTIEKNEVKLNRESTDFGWFYIQEIKKMKTLPYVENMINNAFEKKIAYFD